MPEPIHVIHSDDVLPDPEAPARKKVRKGATIAIGVAVALLLIDDQVKRFQKRKSVTATVADKPEA